MRDDDDRLLDLDQPGRARQHRFGGALSSRGAIYHLNARTGSRSKGQSARAAAAYIQREAEYSRDQADELVYAESGHMPSWAEAEARPPIGTRPTCTSGPTGGYSSGWKWPYP